MQNLARSIVAAIMSDKNDEANKMFESAMAESIKAQVEDYKALVGQQIFEAVEDIGGEFVPEKRDYSVEAIDPSKKSERLPEGEPVHYKVNAYSAATAHKNAIALGHTNIKITDHVGNEVTPIVNEDTGIGAVDASLTAQRREEKAMENAQSARDASQQKAPTIQDVISVLGNTVSVADTSVVNN